MPCGLHIAAARCATACSSDMLMRLLQPEVTCEARTQGPIRPASARWLDLLGTRGMLFECACLCHVYTMYGLTARCTVEAPHHNVACSAQSINNAPSAWIVAPIGTFCSLCAAHMPCIAAAPG